LSLKTVTGSHAIGISDTALINLSPRHLACEFNVCMPAVSRDATCARSPAVAFRMLMPCDWVQLIIERAYAGEKDHVKHALDLFVDFAAIFVRILVRLVKQAQLLHNATCSALVVRGSRALRFCCCRLAAQHRRHVRAGDPHPEAAARGGGPSSEQAPFLAVVTMSSS